MSLRAMGLKPGDEAIHQVDTCSATAMAVMNAGVTPVFADISDRTFMLDCSDVENRIGPANAGLDSYPYVGKSGKRLRACVRWRASEASN